MHFYFFLKDRKEIKCVVYKLRHDLENKVDLFVQSINENWYGIQLRIQTKRSDSYASKKPYQNQKSITGIKSIIDLPIELGSAKSIITRGNILKVYGNREFKQLIEEFHEIEKGNTSSICSEELC